LLQQLLDRCLDDIEKFVSRLQQAASAFSELEKRRIGRKSGGDLVGPGGKYQPVLMPCARMRVQWWTAPKFLIEPMA